MQMPSIVPSLTFLAGLSGKSYANHCVGQGPGACQLDITGYRVYVEDRSGYMYKWENATIYDHKCNVLGAVAKPLEGVAIDSELPYTVVLTWLRVELEHIEFCYASMCYQGNFWCANLDESGMTTVECLHAFECASMDRLVSSG